MPVEPSAEGREDAEQLWMWLQRHVRTAGIQRIADTFAQIRAEARQEGDRAGGYERGFHDARMKMNTALKMVFGRTSALSEYIITAIREAFNGYGPPEPPQGKSSGEAKGKKG